MHMPAWLKGNSGSLGHTAKAVQVRFSWLHGWRRYLPLATLTISAGVVYLLIVSDGEWAARFFALADLNHIPGVAVTPQVLDVCQSWFLAALVVNGISIASAIPSLNESSRGHGTPVGIPVLLGIVLTVNCFGLPLAYFHSSFVPTIATLLMFMAYCASDLAGWWTCKRKGQPTLKFLYPLSFIDFPALILTGFFAWYAHATNSVPIEFIAGTSAAILLLSSLVYAFLSQFIFRENQRASTAP